MNKMFYVEVLTKGAEVEVITLRQGSTLSEMNMQWEKDLLSRGYKVNSLIATTDRGMFYKYALKARLVELRAYVQYGNELMESLTSEEVKKSTRQLLNEHEETLILNVARLAKRCMRRDIEVTDELALQCLDYRETMFARDSEIVGRDALN